MRRLSGKLKGHGNTNTTALLCSVVGEVGCMGSVLRRVAGLDLHGLDLALEVTESVVQLVIRECGP